MGSHGSNYNFNLNGGSSSVNQEKHVEDVEDIFSSNHFRGLHKSTNPSGHNDIFNHFSPSPVPLYDAPVYDDNIFGGIKGVKMVTYNDVFIMRSVSPSPGPTSFEYLVEDLAKNKASVNTKSSGDEALFDDLILGFCNTEPAKPRDSTDTKLQHETCR